VSGFDEDAERPLFDLARRFRGLDLDMPVEHAPLLQSRECIKGVNWLTVLSDAWAERAGGAQAIHKTSGAGAVVHPFPGGVVLQAGTIPRFGDVASAEPMPFYDRAAAALKDIRCDDPALMATNDGIGFDMAEAADWLHRFG
jgi:hypothetical protein